MTNVSEPELSIVVAALNASRTLPACLRALDAQINNRNVEVLVVTPDHHAAQLAQSQFPQFTLIENKGAQLIPELWGLGAARARGRIVAITIATCVPDAHWVESILRAHADGHAAVGGAIENARAASLVDWAVYFVRYTPFMLPFRAGPMEVPGDNGAYLRAAIADQMDWIAARGFWEAEVNAKLRRQGQSLWGDPSIVVYHQHSFDLGGFTRNRLEHARIFGQMRAAQSSAAKRAFYILSAPAIPFVFLARIARNLVRKKRHRARFVVALPLVAWFLLCWSLGEFWGLLRG